MTMKWREIIIDYLLEKNGNKCSWCNNEFSLIAPPEVDHVQSLHSNGEHKLNNLQLVHSICNKRKGRGISIELNKKMFEFNLDIDTNDFNQKMDLQKLYWIRDSLKETHNQSETARVLGMSRRQINYLIYKYGLPNDSNQWDLPEITKTVNQK